MPYKKPYSLAEVTFGLGGSLASDVSRDRIDINDWFVKDGWRRDLDADVVREGWDYWQPNVAFTQAQQKYTGATADVLAIEEIKSPAGLAVIVAVVGSTIRAFSYDTGTWTQIGSGFQTTGIRRWQIVQLNGYAIFNNGVDLPVYWRVGAANVLPLYELREKGVASVGYITEYSGVLMAFDITEVNDAYMSTLMNSGSPYGLVPVPATNTSRTQYRIIWSNESDPLDWAAVVNATGTGGTNAITLAWPMASMFVGQEVTLVGGGPSGGNLVTTIATIAGTAVTLAVNLSTSVTAEPFSATAALGSIVGFYDIQDDGSAIIAAMPLQNRLVVYRSFSIFIGVYTGQTDFPFQFDRTYQGDRAPRFAYTLTNVRGQYHLYAGANGFFRYRLGSLEPEMDEVMTKCAVSQFLGKNYAVADYPNIYSADNGVTNEVMFTMKVSSTRTILANDYEYGTASSILSGWGFTACATVRRPLAGNIGDDSELIFIMGDSAGNITQYGRTSKTLNAMMRYGVAWDATVETPLLWFSDSFNEKDLRTFVPLFKSASGARAMSVISYTYGDVAHTGTARTTQSVPSPTGDTIVPLWQRAMYHSFKLTVTNDSASAQVQLTGYVCEYETVGTRSVTRMS